MIKHRKIILKTPLYVYIETLYTVNGGTSLSYKLGRNADLQMELIQTLSKRVKLNYKSPVFSKFVSNIKLPDDLCPFGVDIDCRPYLYFRSFDGRCNNLELKMAGATHMPYLRFLKPDYDDGYNLPRTQTNNYMKLPNERIIAQGIHYPNDTSSKISSAFLYFGN